MKKMILAAAAAASLLGAGALASTADAHPFGGGHGGHGPVVHGGGFGFHGGYHGGFRGFRYGGWSRGGFWPRGYGYVVIDPVVYGVYAAPYSYRWVRAEDGALVLMNVDTGVIRDVIIR
jgi:hypothetical protein